ncbi:MAG: hypothetical protein ACFBWO_03920 [Paracoccaceae bacterium]
MDERADPGDGRLARPTGEGDGGEVVIEVGREAGADRGTGWSGARAAAFGDWIARNRGLLERGRDAVHVVVPLAPPPARLPLIAASLAAEGLLTYDDARTGKVRRGDAGMRGVGLALDAIGLAASARLAPRALTANARRIAMLRAAFARIEQSRRARE